MDEKTPSLKDYYAIVRRRRWQMLLTFLVVMLLSTLFAFGLPAKYRSTAIIAIQEQEIPEDLVRTTITSFADERIQRITQQAMTSLNLSRIIDEHKLYAADIDRVPRSEIIEDMREDIHMELVSADVIDPRSGRPTRATIAFTLAFDHKSPTLAQKVTNNLVTLYQSVNLEDRKDSVEGTSEYLTDLVRDQNERVLDLEEQLAQFKQKNAGALPDFLKVNLDILQRFERDQAATEGRLQSLQTQIIMLEGQLMTTDPHLPGMANARGAADPQQMLEMLRNELRVTTSQYGDSHPDVKRLQRMIADLGGETGLSGQRGIGQIDEQLIAARNELDTARGRYGDEHPEISRLERLLAALESDRDRSLDALLNVGRVRPASHIADSINVRQGPGTDTPVVGTLQQGASATLVDSSNASWYKIVLGDGTQGFVSKSVSLAGDDAPTRSALDSPTSPAYIQLQANLASAQAEAQSLVNRYRNLDAKIEEYTARINQTPLVERRYSALTRDLNEARLQLTDYKMKAEEAKRAVDIEFRQKAQQFSLLEPPIAPVSPHSPNRAALLTLGFVLALFGTLAAAAIAESLDTAIRSASEVVQIAGMAPLAVIPMIGGEHDSRSTRRVLYAIVGGVAATLALIAVLIHWFFRPLDVLWYQVLRTLGL